MSHDSKPHNVEFFYRGAMTRNEQWPVAVGALAFFGLQIAVALGFLIFG